MSEGGVRLEHLFSRMDVASVTFGFGPVKRSIACFKCLPCFTIMLYSFFQCAWPVFGLGGLKSSGFGMNLFMAL